MEIRERPRRLEREIKRANVPKPQEYAEAHRRRMTDLHEKWADELGVPGSSLPNAEDRAILAHDSPQQRRKNEGVMGVEPGRRPESCGGRGTGEAASHAVATARRSLGARRSREMSRRVSRGPSGGCRTPSAEHLLDTRTILGTDRQLVSNTILFE